MGLPQVPGKPAPEEAFPFGTAAVPVEPTTRTRREDKGRTMLPVAAFGRVLFAKTANGVDAGWERVWF